MFQEKSFHKCINPVGPGGRKCGCCFPQKGKGHVMAKKQEKRQQRRFFSKLLKEELKDQTLGS